jgi:hypothetical protein
MALPRAAARLDREEPQAGPWTGQLRSSDMDEPFVVTDSDLARARHDKEFRQRLLTESLELLLSELGKLRRATPTGARIDQVREGVELAVKLADLVRRSAPRAA